MKSHGCNLPSAGRGNQDHQRQGRDFWEQTSLNRFWDVCAVLPIPPHTTSSAPKRENRFDMISDFRYAQDQPCSRSQPVIGREASEIAYAASGGSKVPFAWYDDGCNSCSGPPHFRETFGSSFSAISQLFRNFPRRQEKRSLGNNGYSYSLIWTSQILQFSSQFWSISVKTFS